MTKDLYQSLYEDKNINYGDDEAGRCPATRYLPLFEKWLIPPIIDLGCGRGQLVLKLREKGLEAYGVDQVELNNGMTVADITKPVPASIGGFQTVVCIDVFEHMCDEDLVYVLRNMSYSKHQVISVFNGHTKESGHPEELHINVKPNWDDWEKLINSLLVIKEMVPIRSGNARRVYLCERPN